MKRLLLIGMLLIAITTILPTYAYAQVPHLELMMLSNPNVMAVALQLPETRLLNFGRSVGFASVRRYDIRISADVVHAFDYHPASHLNGTVGLGMNWGMTLPVPASMFQGTYVGSIFLKTGVESRMDTLKKYHAQNYTYSFGVDHQIPFTDFMYAVSKTATPAKLSAAISLIRQLPPIDSSTIRADAGLDWTVPMAGGTSWVTTGEGHWAKDIQPYALLTSGATYRLPMQTGSLPIGIEPIAFVRYVVGKRPPTYEMLDHWEYGFTTQINFGSNTVAKVKAK